MKKVTHLALSILTLGTIISSCNNNEQKTETMDTKTGITKAPFGEADGKEVFLYTLRNAKGTEVKITNYGGIVTSWVAPDKDGKSTSIVLGFDSLSGYLAKPPYFGALIGR